MTRFDPWPVWPINPIDPIQTRPDPPVLPCLELPIEFYGNSILQKVGNQLAKLLKIDACTIDNVRGCFARLCIQVVLDFPLRSSCNMRASYWYALNVAALDTWQTTALSSSAPALLSLPLLQNPMLTWLSKAKNLLVIGCLLKVGNQDPPNLALPTILGWTQTHRPTKEHYHHTNHVPTTLFT